MSSASSTPRITGDQLRSGYHRQIWWSWLIGTAFFMGEVGAGLFAVSLFTEFLPGIIAGYLVVMVGKNGAHLLYLGRPERFWRAALRPDRSWIARGIWATGLFGGTGLIWIGFMTGFVPGMSTILGPLVFWVAILSALFIMFYDGQVMSVQGSVPFWQTPLLPVLCFTYASLGGVTVWLLMQEVYRTATSDLYGTLLIVEQALIILNFFIVSLYVFLKSRQPNAAGLTALTWIRGTYAPVFWGVVLFLGLMMAFALSISHYWLHGIWVPLGVAIAELTGDYALLIVLLKSGLYRDKSDPIR